MLEECGADAAHDVARLRRRGKLPHRLPAHNATRTSRNLDFALHNRQFGPSAPPPPSRTLSAPMPFSKLAIAVTVAFEAAGPV